MVLGLPSVEEAAAVLGRDPATLVNDPELGRYPELGVPSDEVTWLLFQRGVPCCEWLPLTAWPEDSWRRSSGHLLTRPTDEDLSAYCQRDDAAVIAGVPSKNLEEAMHWVVVHAGVVYDPAPPHAERYGAQDFPLEVSVAVIVSLGDGGSAS